MLHYQRNILQLQKAVKAGGVRGSNIQSQYIDLDLGVLWSIDGPATPAVAGVRSWVARGSDVLWGIRGSVGSSTSSWYTHRQQGLYGVCCNTVFLKLLLLLRQYTLP